MTLTEQYRINGQPMPAPDENMELSFEDIDAADAGRDESGVMHRIPVRLKVGKWGFSYHCLTGEEMALLGSLLPREGTFAFTYPDLVTGAPVETRAYLSGFTALWNRDLTRDLKFNIIEV